jgi:hypothetical protein
MQQRRGSASQWSDINPVLAAGEIGFEVDTLTFKVGNGSDNWDTLPYFQNAEDVQALISDVVGLAPEDLDTLKELADSINNDPDFFGTISSDISDLSDTVDTKAPLASPTFSGTVDFSGASVNGLDLLPSQTSNSGKYLTTDGTDPSWSEISTQELSDVQISTLSDNQILQYDTTSSKWINTDISIAQDLADLGDVVYSGSPTEDQLLVFDGTNWSNSTSLGNVSTDVVTARGYSFTPLDAITSQSGATLTISLPNKSGVFFHDIDTVDDVSEINVEANASSGSERILKIYSPQLTDIFVLTSNGYNVWANGSILSSIAGGTIAIITFKTYVGDDTVYCSYELYDRPF